MIHHIVAQVIKPIFVIGAIGYASSVSSLLVAVVHLGEDHTDTDAKELIDTPHPFRIPLGEIVIHRYQMNTFVGQGIEVCRQGRHQRFTFARTHLSDLAAM